MHGAEWRVISRIVFDARVVLSPFERINLHYSTPVCASFKDTRHNAERHRLQMGP